MWDLRGIYEPGFRYKKTGVLFLDLAPAASVQGSLFIRPDTPQRVRLMELGTSNYRDDSGLWEGSAGC